MQTSERPLTTIGNANVTTTAGKTKARSELCNVEKAHKRVSYLNKITPIRHLQIRTCTLHLHPKLLRHTKAKLGPPPILSHGN